MSNPQHEPTMEEILASIRKIISEDASDAEPATAPGPIQDAESPPPAPRPEPKLASPAVVPSEDNEDVLDLTEAVEDEEPAPEVEVRASTPPKAPEPEPHDDVVFQEEEPVVPPAPAPVASEEPSKAHDDGLFREHARSAFDDALHSIEAATSAPEPAAMAAPTRSYDGPTLAGAFDKAVRDAFDPILRDWLDQNAAELIERIKPEIAAILDRHLPDLLANAVREEIARAKARTGR